MHQRDSRLTIVIATRDHPLRIRPQLRLFEEAHYACPVIVADSGLAAQTASMRAATRCKVEYRSFEPGLTLCAKLASVVASVDTPLVLLSPDRKILFPHAIDAGVDHLLQHPDHVAAMGYGIGFTRRDKVVDIDRVVVFTPSVADDDPLRRHYHLMQRYQPWLWGLFRRDALAQALSAASGVRGYMFQEIMLGNALVLQGKFARLPLIFRMEGAEQSMTALKESDPLYWFLDDPRSFFRHYIHYRNQLARFIAAQGIAAPTGTDVRGLIDTVHALWLRQNFDEGVLNYAVRRLLGEAISPLATMRPRPEWQQLGRDDVASPSKDPRYIWRRAVLDAEPRGEVTISRDEMKRVERQLDTYRTWQVD